MYDYDDNAPTNQYPQADVPESWGYSLIAVTDDGDTLCERCVTDPSNPVHKASFDDPCPDGWGVVGWLASGEIDDRTVCAHCGDVLVDDLI